MTIAGYGFDMIGAYESGATEHPQKEIKKLFPDAHDFECYSIGDCWLFNAQERADLPSYIRKLDEPFVPTERAYDERGQKIEYVPRRCAKRSEVH